LVKEKMKPKRALGYRRKQLGAGNDKSGFTDKNC
jgi:hypothetical protein